MTKQKPGQDRPDKVREGKYAMYFHCQTTLVDTFFWNSLNRLTSIAGSLLIYTGSGSYGVWPERRSGFNVEFVNKLCGTGGCLYTLIDGR